MTTVIGIDPSLRSTGLARVTLACATVDSPHAITVDRCAETAVVRTRGRRHDDVTVRCQRLIDIAADVCGWSLPADLVVIEGPSLGSGISAAAWDRAGLWWRIVTRLHAAPVPVAVVPPTVRAKWITGSGRADKHAVREAITRLWHPYWTPYYARDDNEADALVLASMGAQWLGWLPVAGPDPDVLASAQWPDREAIAA